MAPRSRGAFEHGGVLLAEAGTGTGKTLAYLVPAILSRQRVLVSTGTKNLQEQIYFKDIPALRAGARRPVHRHLHEGPRELPVPASARSAERAAPGRPSHDVFLPIIREWAARTETGDRAELEDLPEDLPFWNEVVGDRRNLPRHRVPALRRLLRHADAAARRRVRRRHRQPSSAVRRRGGAAERLRRSDSRVQPRDRRRSAPARGRRDAVLRLQRQHLPRRGARARRRAAGRQSAAVDRTRRRTRSRRRSSTLRDHARAFFAELAFAHRGNGRLPRRRARARDRRRRWRHARGGRRSDRRARSSSRRRWRCSTARRRRTSRTRDAGIDGRTSRRWRAAPARSATSCASCCAPATPTTSISSSSAARGIFLRASPIDVSAIVRELLFDRMRTTVLTSATLTVDGTLRLHPRAARHRAGRRNPPAVGVRFRDAGDPVSAAADARPALAGLRDRPPAARWSRS